MNTGFVIFMLAVGFSSGAAFSLILNITGGIGGTLATFGLPAAMYLKTHDKTDNFYGASYFILVGGFIMMIGIFYGIVDDQLSINSNSDS